jgi:hypothetical protein
MMTRFLCMLIIVTTTLMAAGCAIVPTRKSLPEKFRNVAQIPGIPEARMWGDDAMNTEHQYFTMPQEEIAARYPALIEVPHNYLAISGGGANGAFGAGLLVGWTATGTRPEFSLVTGISSGALIAPFAFLGSAYDDQLREVYTTYSTKDLITKHTLLEILTGYSMVDTAPLRQLMAKYYNQKMIAAIADEHRKGRRLYVGTTNLDAQRPVIWSIGAIAASGASNAIELIHDVILASASIPGAFPPVIINVEAEGTAYDEMHVDGGTSNQAFLYPSDVDWRRVIKGLKVKGTPVGYVIRNSRLVPRWGTTEIKIVDIARRSIDSLIRTQGLGDLYRIYLYCRRDGIDFKLVHIPDDFELKPNELFDPLYMKQLFELGRQMAVSGSAWLDSPPDLNMMSK